MPAMLAPPRIGEVPVYDLNPLGGEIRIRLEHPGELHAVFRHERVRLAAVCPLPTFLKLVTADDVGRLRRRR